MRIRRGLSRAAGVLLAAMVCLETAWPAAGELPAQSSDAADTVVTASGDDYGSYSRAHQEASRPMTDIRLEGPGFSASAAPDKALAQAGERQGAVIGEENAWCQWTFSVEQEGLYVIWLDYYALPGKGKDLEFSLELDGKQPFSEAGRLSLSRIWKDGPVERDANDNDLRPKQEEVHRWNVRYLINGDGYYSDPYAFYLTQGSHTLKLTAAQESMAVAAIRLGNDEALPTYKEYSRDAVPAAEYIRVQEAEATLEKSSSMLYPTYDRSTSATSPSHHSRIRLNTIGQTNWQYPNQWLSWSVEVPRDGWYQITFKSRQNFQQGMNSYRALYLDGKIPFAEAASLQFPYDMNWYMKTVGDEDGQPYLFYLTAGQPHTLTLECTAGPMASVLKGLNDAMLALNAIYRSIIMVTGVNPDPYRSFYLEDEIPDLMDNLKAARADLQEMYDAIQAQTGVKGSQASLLKQVVVMLDDFIGKPLQIPERVGAFKDNIESLGSLALTLGEPPLELDYIVVSSKSELPAVKATFWEDFVYNLHGFTDSFVSDYNSIGQVYTGDAVTVWISNGRDQAQVLKSLIDNTFTPKTGIPINLSVVNTVSGLTQSILVQATMAGKGPDVALFTPKDMVVNLAMRGALEDFSKLDGYEAMTDWFYPSAWIPYRHEGGVYGIPETQNFDVMFYRRDILEELGLKPPETWDDFYAAISVLQQNNLQVGVQETFSQGLSYSSGSLGISAGISMFDKFLYQNGGQYYTDDLKATMFTSQTAANAFVRWTELYTEYGLDRSFDFYNRFRNGEMPLGIMSYATYNQLYVAAPEIRGLWDFTLIPGTEKADGTIDRTETAGGTAAIMLADLPNRDAAFSFIRWWTGAETQSQYGTELETILGIIARYDTANREAFDTLSWSEKEAAVLKEQWKSVTDVPQIPGNYFVSRCLTNAFRTVMDEKGNPVRVLNSFNKDMNSEITRKRQEFKLD